MVTNEGNDVIQEQVDEICDVIQEHVDKVCESLPEGHKVVLQQ